MNASIDQVWLEKLKQVTVRGEELKSHLINLDCVQFESIASGLTNTVRVPQRDMKIGDSVVLIRTKRNTTTSMRCVALVTGIAQDQNYMTLELNIVTVYNEPLGMKLN